MSINPAKIARDVNAGQALAIGNVANIAFIDPSARRTIVAESASKSVNNPYVGLELPGRVIHTVYRGYLTVRNGELAKAGRN
jgi:dihydroorotase